MGLMGSSCHQAGQLGVQACLALWVQVDQAQDNVGGDEACKTRPAQAWLLAEQLSSPGSGLVPTV